MTLPKLSATNQMVVYQLFFKCACKAIIQDSGLLRLEGDTWCFSVTTDVTWLPDAFLCYSLFKPRLLASSQCCAMRLAQLATNWRETLRLVTWTVGHLFTSIDSATGFRCRCDTGRSISCSGEPRPALLRRQTRMGNVRHFVFVQTKLPA